MHFVNVWVILVVAAAMAKCSKAREKRVSAHSVVMANNKKSQSAMRTIAAMNCMEAEGKRRLSRKQNQRRKRKMHHLRRFQQHKPHGHSISPEEIGEGCFCGCPPPFTLCDGPGGFVHWLDEENGVFSSCKVPRKDVLRSVSPENADAVVDALEILQKTEASCKRGKGQQGVTEDPKNKCTIFGCRVLQGKGFSRAKVVEKCPTAAAVLEEFAARLEHVASACIPFDWLRKITKVSKMVSLDTIGKCVFGAALASAVDCSAPAHLDDDFFLSVHQLNAGGCLHKAETAQHFCFPTCGYAVALKPGDVLLFNPHVHHCLSAKSPECKGIRVHVTTMHLKNRHVSKNDKDATLTEEEKEMCDFSFEGN